MKKIKFIFPLTAEPETAMHGLAEDFFFNFQLLICCQEIYPLIIKS